MAVFKRFSAKYAVQGVRFLSAPSKIVYDTNPGSAELRLLLLMQAEWPGRCITMSQVECSLIIKEHIHFHEVYQ